MKIETLLADAIVPAWWHWAVFGGVVAALLLLDLAVFHRRADQHEPTLKQVAFWTVFWIAVAPAFNGLVWWWGGSTNAIYFLTGYLVEWSLSMDNVFVFALIFQFFKVPLKYQYRVLFWGILGAIVLRLAFVLLGATLLHHFAWITWVFGVFLVYTGVKLCLKPIRRSHPDQNLLMRLGRKLFNVSREDQGSKFFVREGGRNCVTPLFLVLLVVEGTDVLFAVDSVPAIFGITTDPFIVFTSNIFAILGLRALYFLLAGVMKIFHYLNYGLAAVLIFVGAKMIAEYWLGWHFFKDYPWASLVVIVVLLGISIVASLLTAPKDQQQVAQRDPSS